MTELVGIDPAGLLGERVRINDFFFFSSVCFSADFCDQFAKRRVLQTVSAS
jgi:hypothetical protein